ncbi:MAG: aspartate dehydrogenase, partial [Candidatus Omnitrophica bacterium]|nr:aspartate dehydrogenase [Candidatus Omnitrophota bacterium]
MSKLRIGIVGCGAIGGSLVKEILKNFSSQVEIVALYDLDRDKVFSLLRNLSLKDDLCVNSLERLINRSNLIIEASSKDAVWEITRKVIQNRKDILILSIGGIVRHFRELLNLIQRYNTNVYLPSGAILG